ncbi:hypothetical protein B566_EDAN014605 [Ephemera danica]|nr:hypothetical protein B566_EDAN014605 [Ephemera danica]
MAFAGLKKQINKANQYMTEKMGGAEGTKLDLEFVDMERKTDVTYELVEELQVKTKEFLQPNPNARAKMAAVKGISKLSGQAKANTYPQPDGVLGDCMVTYGRKLGEDSHFALALIEMGESLKQMADVKYSLDDNIKQNFLEPLHHLQTKDLKEVMHHRKKLQGRRLDYDCKRRKQSKVLLYEHAVDICCFIFLCHISRGAGSMRRHKRTNNVGVCFMLCLALPLLYLPDLCDDSKTTTKNSQQAGVRKGPTAGLSPSPYGSPAHSPAGGMTATGSNVLDDDIKSAEEKFAESLHLAQMGMFNLLENDVEQISQLATFTEGLLEYHQQCVEILKVLNETMQEKREEAANRPKAEFIPKTLSDIVVDPIPDGLNGAHPPSVKHNNSTKLSSAHGHARAHRSNPPPPTIGWNVPQVKIIPGRSPFISPASTPVHQPNSLLFATPDNAQAKQGGTPSSQDEGHQGKMRLGKYFQPLTAQASTFALAAKGLFLINVDYTFEGGSSPVLNKPTHLELGGSDTQARSNAVSSVGGVPDACGRSDIHVALVAASPLPSPMRSPARTPMKQAPCCTALYDFEAENPGELGFKEGDNITLVNRVDDNWYEGSVNGKTGYFPVSYVQVVVPLP